MEPTQDSLTADTFKGLPRRIHIGGYTFRIKVVPHEHAGLAGSNGMTDCESATIHLFEGLTSRALEVTQHELTHAINWVYGVDDGAQEEHFTTQHSKGTIELWLRNPKLFAWFNKTLRRMRRESTHD